MKNKLIPLFMKNSHNIIQYLFWLYFLFVIGYHLYSDYIPKVMGFIFWLLCGIYLGYMLGIKSRTYNNNEK
jgi:hypothetical protein